jgi:hypothetical protein
MNDIEALRKRLGPAATAYTEAQLEQLDRDLDAMADLLLDLYIEEMSARRSDEAPSSGAFDSPGQGALESE